MAANDDFAGYVRSPAVAPIHAVAVVADNTNTFSNVSLAIYVGTTGNAEILTKSGETVVFRNIPAGTIIPIQATRVNISNTTASNMVMMY